MRNRLAALVAALVFVCPQIAAAADWSPKAITSGQATWTEAGTADSGLLCVWNVAKCTNNHASTAVWIYTADGGTKASQPWAKVPAATSCSNDDGNLTCMSTLLDAGCYIADPQGTGGAMTCTGRSR